MDLETSVNRAPEDRRGCGEGSRLLRRDPRDKGPGSEKLNVARIPRMQQGYAGTGKCSKEQQTAGICGIEGRDLGFAGICGNSAGDSRDLWDRGPGFARICGNSAGFHKEERTAGICEIESRDLQESAVNTLQPGSLG